jgi:hypothetical protein
MRLHKGEKVKLPRTFELDEIRGKIGRVSNDLHLLRTGCSILSDRNCSRRVYFTRLPLKNK